LDGLLALQCKGGSTTTKFGGSLLTFLPHATTAEVSGLKTTESNFVISGACLLCYGSSPNDLHHARYYLRLQ
jgi:hypothetical protein